MQLQGEAIRFRVNIGCPQGGVLSPLLWSLLMNSLLDALDRRRVELQAYADDLII
ncbi:hypothetical protein GO639_04905 [Staphylococcus aureus]|nr:hypothetical protein [Staphylococcus aureus]